jgi:MauM/NapG family ferredoxin protein
VDQLSRRHWLATGGGAGCGILLGGLFRHALPEPRTQPLVRPPGAASESEFLAQCIRCGQCVLACPEDADVLRLADLSHGLAAGTPYADDLRQRPCTLCQGHNGLQCIDACPTSALAPVAILSEIEMGLAFIDQETCWAYNGIICRTCWHACPWPDEAIRLNARLQVEIDREACVGCGLCVRACPVEPSAIVVKPNSELASASDTDGIGA